MSLARTLLVFSVLIVAVVLLNGVARSDPPAGSPATNPAASRPAATQPAYPLWDGKESVKDYAKRADIKERDNKREMARATRFRR